MTQQYSASKYEGDASECGALFKYEGKWYAPNIEFRRLLGFFGETLVRDVISNSNKAFTPSDISGEAASVIYKVCLSLKKSRK
jgi:hypothetical protein